MKSDGIGIRLYATVPTILCLLFVLSSAAFGFSTHNTTVSRTFDPVEAAVRESITVRVTFTNSEANNLRGFYYTEQIPQGLTVDTESIAVKINDNPVSNYIFESGSVGDVYPGYIPHRWVLETPPTFAENNPIPPNYTVEIVYSVSSTQEGTFDFDEFNWVGYYQNAAEGEREAFGHSEDADKQTITFLNATPVANDDTASTTEDTPVTINVVVNDTDADGEIVPDSVLIVNAPVYGSVFDHGDGTVTYTPDADTNGIHTFGYTVGDDDGVRSNEATVTVTVKEIVERLDLDLKIKELKDGAATEDDVKAMIEQYMERP
ncbi:MAG: cadherin-like domain-containing protein [Proteobacteria bacterium]|nr:cadherin-like domain-containing protein [Pseudomonadota bacterium]